MLLLTEDLPPAQLAVQELVLALLVLPAGRVAPETVRVEDLRFYQGRDSLASHGFGNIFYLYRQSSGRINF